LLDARLLLLYPVWQSLHLGLGSEWLQRAHTELAWLMQAF